MADSSSTSYTHDSLGRPIVSLEERRRQTALELAVANIGRTEEQMLKAGTDRIIARAEAFEAYLEGNDS